MCLSCVQWMIFVYLLRRRRRMRRKLASCPSLSPWTMFVSWWFCVLFIRILLVHFTRPNLYWSSFFFMSEPEQMLSIISLLETCCLFVFNYVLYGGKTIVCVILFLLLDSCLLRPPPPVLSSFCQDCQQCALLRISRRPVWHLLIRFLFWSITSVFVRVCFVYHTPTT